MASRLSLAVVCLVLAAACGSAPPPPPAGSRQGSSTPFVIGLIPEQNIFDQMARHEPLARYLSAELGVEVRLRMFSSYGTAIDDLASADLDGAFVGSFAYALARVRLGVSPVARPVNLDNTSTYYGLMFTRKDSGIRTMQDMRGKRFVFVDRATTAGYLLPLDYFYESGVEDYEAYLGETYFAGTHEGTIYDVLEGRADIGAAKNTVLARLAGADPRIGRELSLLGRSPDVPENSLVLRPDLDDALCGRLKNALLAMHEDPNGRQALQRLGALRFVETTDEDYAPVYRYAEEVRVDLSSYDLHQP